LTEYVNQQNANVYVPQGLMIINPMERGLRVVSFEILWWSIIDNIILDLFSNLRIVNGEFQ
jgi:hypothetical protein